jgi:hypothetical protein
MRFAWIENDQIRDIAPAGDPSEFYHPDIAKLYDTEVPDEAQNGDGWVDGVLVPRPAPEPVAPTPAAPVYPTVGVIAFKLLFTAQERIAVKTSTDPVVQDFWQLVEDPRTTEVNLALKSVQDAIRYLESQSLIGEGRADEVLTGVVA